MRAAALATIEPSLSGGGTATARECWRCESAVDCAIARMCLGHPTGAIRMAAVNRAIKTMRDNLAEPMSLTSLSRAALLSPFHFHRVFRHVTSTTPARYLTALRIAEAKRLLACTSISVTEVSGYVGYARIGTFTSQFSRQVGTSPRTFRELMAEIGHRPMAELLATLQDCVGAASGGPTGVLAGGGGEQSPVLLGLFPSGVPQQRPVACAVTSSPGRVQLGPVPDGSYEALAVGFDPAATVLQALADHRAPVRFVGMSDRPVVASDGRCDAAFQVALRRPRFTDPPVVLGLPLLVAAELSGSAAR